jgi:chemotaxis protein CheD
MLFDTPQVTSVGMGQIVLGRKADRLSAVLGSCIGLALYHTRLHVGALGHLVLPDSAGRQGCPGKFADTAIPAMLAQLEQAGVPRESLVAKVAGGACMFGKGGPLQIGEANAEAVFQLLRKLGIRVAGRDVGGDKGRRVTLDCSTGQLLVEIVGQPVRIL